MRSKLLKTLTTLALSVCMVISVISAIVFGVGANGSIDAVAAGEQTYEKVELADIAFTDKIIIVSTKGTGNDTVNYAMSNDKGTSAAPTAVPVTISGNTITTETTDETNIFWNISKSDDGYIIYPDGSEKTWLYCTSTNNGVRVGTNANKIFTLDSKSGYLKHTGTSRYLGVYNNQDWRCYTNTTGNTAGQTFSFYKLKPECLHTDTTKVAEEPATCTTPGTTAGVYCNDCNTYISGHEEIPAGHKYENGECTVCHEKQPTTLTINRGSFGKGSGYAWYAWTATATTGETVSGNGYMYVTATSFIQMNADQPGNYIYNSAPLPGSIVSVTLTAEKETFRDFYVLTSDKAYDKSTNKLTDFTGATAKNVTTSGATWDFTTTNKYFAIVVTGGAAYLSSIEITYKVCSHANTENVAEVPATCTTPGTTAGVVCSDCGKILEAQTTIPATGHKDENSDNICENCGASLCTTHTWVETSRIDATCTENGSAEYECSKCHETKTETLTATGHTEVIDEARAATCTETGLTEGKHCSVCNTVLEPQTTIPMTAHDYKNGKCTVCGTIKSSYIKVTTELADLSGTYLIVYEAGNVAFDGSLTTLDAESNTQSVTITNNTITDDLSAYTFTIAAVEGGYSIQSKSGFYIGQTSDKNGLVTSETEVYTNTISFNEDGTVNIIGKGGAYLRYNATSGQERFRYYKSSSYTNQEAIALYKLVPDPVVKGVALSLNKGITVKVTYDISAAWLALNEGAKVVFSNGKEFSKEFTATAGANEYSVDLTPAQINDALTVKIQLADGSDFGTATDVSVSAYKAKVETAYTNGKLNYTEEKYNALIALLDAALTYSNAADGAIEEALENDFAGVDDLTILHTNEAAKLFTGCAGTLSTYASVRIAVNTAKIPEGGDTLIIKVGTGENEKELYNGNFADRLADNQIVIDGIYPLNFDDTIYIEASKEGSKATFTFNEYLKAVYNSTTTEQSVKNLAVATYLYGKAAKAFFG